MPLFETIKTNAGTQPKNELQQWALVWQLLLGCLLRNFEETVAKPPLPPSAAKFFCHFSLNCTFLNYLSPTNFFGKINILNKHHKSSFHTKAHCCSSFFGWVPALVLMVSKSGTSAPPPLFKNTNSVQWF